MSLDRGWRTVLIAASGPSLNTEDCALAMMAQESGTWKIIAINNNYLSVPSAAVLYAGDGSWYRQHIAAIKASGFHGELWTQDHKAAMDLGLHWIESRPGAGIANEALLIKQGGSSGHQAICLARLFGAKKIVLIGYDMQRTDGKMHWHGPHRNPLSNGNPAGFIPALNMLAPQLKAEGIEVINATRETALKCFTRGDLAEALA